MLRPETLNYYNKNIHFFKYPKQVANDYFFDFLNLKTDFRQHTPCLLTSSSFCKVNEKNWWKITEKWQFTNIAKKETIIYSKI